MEEEKFKEMSINGVKTKVKETILKSRAMREKKVEIEINGKKIRVMPHLLGDMAKFGATETRRTIKNPPRELLHMIPAKVILPTVDKKPEANPSDFPKEAPVKTIKEPAKETLVPEKVVEEVKKRKTPVRSKTKK